ncbi:MAG: M55 family metallopeptidase, partial [Acetobacteraceae bacterium]|nr:M55 family metallopeptidase [Acetobacteraceae bacterium]
MIGREATMKIFISADMDGVAGVATPRQCDMDN